MMNVQTITTDFFDSNIYLFSRNGKRFLVDCGGTPENMKQMLEQLSFWPDYVLLTHGHIDHVLSLSLFADGVTVIIHPEDAKYLTDPSFNLSGMLLGRKMTFDVPVGDGGFLWEDFGIRMIHTPGHSPGSVCYLIDDCLFSGDTLFCGGIGNTSFPGGDYELEICSVRRLLALDGNITLYPGHGPSGSISAEKNMF